MCQQPFYIIQRHIIMSDADVWMVWCSLDFRLNLAQKCSCIFHQNQWLVYSCICRVYWNEPNRFHECLDNLELLVHWFYKKKSGRHFIEWGFLYLICRIRHVKKFKSIYALNCELEWLCLYILYRGYTKKFTGIGANLSMQFLWLNLKGLLPKNTKKILMFFAFSP